MSSGGDTLLNFAQNEIQGVCRHQLGCACKRAGRTPKPVELDASLDPRPHLAACPNGSPECCCSPHARCIKNAGVGCAKGVAATWKVRHPVGGRAQDSMLPSAPRPHGPHWLLARCPPPWAAAPRRAPLLSPPAPRLAPPLSPAVDDWRARDRSRPRSRSGEGERRVRGGSARGAGARVRVLPPPRLPRVVRLPLPSPSSLSLPRPESFLVVCSAFF